MDCSLPGSYGHADSPGKNTGVRCHALLQGIFLTQGSKSRLLYLLHCRQILHILSHQGSLYGLESQKHVTRGEQSSGEIGKEKDRFLEMA